LAIERDDVVDAVGKVIPTTTNFARRPDASEAPDRYYSQLSNTVLAAMHADDRAVFYLAYLAATRFRTDIESVLALTETMLSDGGIRALENPELTRIVTTEGLSSARASLGRLDAHLVTGAYADEQVSAFRQQVKEYLQDAVAPNLRSGGSRTGARALLRGVLPSLERGLARLEGGKASVRASVDEGAALDLRTLISARVSTACATLLRALEQEVPLLNDEDQAARMESIATELAAAYAAMGAVGTAQTPLGEVVTGPRDDAYTERAFKAATGLAAVAPPAAVLAGFNGRVYVDPLVLGTQGFAQDDLDGDLTTPKFQDTSTPDWSVLGLSVGDSLFLYATGVTHRVVSDPATTVDHLRVVPEISKNIADTKWFVTREPAGTYFEDPNVDFWVKYEDGQTASSVISSGTKGFYPRTVEASGSGATRVLLAGAAGEGDPWFLSGPPDGALIIPGYYFTYLGASFITDGVAPGWDLELGDGASTVLTIQYALSEDYLVVDPPFTVDVYPNWRIVRWPSNDRVLSQPGAGFLTANVQVGSVVEIYGTASNDGLYSVVEVLSDDAVRLDSTLLHETGMGWRVLLPDDEVVDTDAAFLSDGITAGDVVYLDGSPHAVDEVLSQTRLRLTSSWVQTDFVSGHEWLTYRDDAVSQSFDQDDGIDLSLLPPVVNGYPVALRVAGSDVPWSRPTPGRSTALDLRAGVPYDDAPLLEWSVRAGDWTDRFSDFANSPFDGLPLGTTLALWPGEANEQRVQVLEIYGASEVRVSGRIPQGVSGIPYALYDPVYPRHELLYEGVRYPIDQIVDGRLRLSRPVPPAVGIDLDYFIVEPTSSDVSDRLTDEDGALEYDAVGGFGQELVGTLLKINSTPTYKVPVLEVIDLDGDGVNDTLTVRTKFNVGRSRVPYEVWAEVEGRTTELRLPGAAVGAEEGDLLTLWTVPATRAVVSEDPTGGYTEVSLTEVIPAGVAGALAVVTRGGSNEYGRWLLFDHQLEALPVPGSDLTQLSAFLARAFQDGGEEGDSVASGGPVVVRNDGDDDDLTPLLELDVDVELAGARYGELITLTHAGGARSRHYITQVDSDRVSITPEVDVALVVASWAMERTSISEALYRTSVIDSRLREIAALLDQYEVAPSESVRAALALLVESGLDRASDTLRSGNLPGLSSLSREAASYLGNAASALRSAGGSVDSAGRGRPGDGNLARGDGAAALGALGGAHAGMGQAALRLGADEHAKRVSEVSPEDERNRAVYELVGTPVTDAVSEQDDTLPWLAQTGSKVDRINRDIEGAKAALQYIIDHPDEFTEVG